MGNDDIETKLAEIRGRVAAAAQRSGRDASDVMLMAVTKTKPAEVIRALLDAGVRDFGENYPEETEEKIAAFDAPDTRIYMIGHLQSRKVKIVGKMFHAWQSLDSLEIARKMDAFCAEQKRVMPALVECNVGGEESKHGWNFTQGVTDDFLRDFEMIMSLPNLRVQGLMTLPPYTAVGDENRRYFVQMREIRDLLNQKFAIELTQLSMGTSSDYETAIEEGATCVRIGTALVGARIYK